MTLVRIVVSQHAEERIATRIGKPLDILDFQPTQLFGTDSGCPRRVWRDADGNALLIAEKREGDVLTLYVVTAIAAGMQVAGGGEWRPDVPPRLARLSDGTIVERPSVADRWAAIDAGVRESIESRLSARLRTEPGLLDGDYARSVGIDPELAAHVLGLLGACRTAAGRWNPPLPKPKSQQWVPVGVASRG